MPVIPANRNDMIQFFHTRLSIWTAQAANIGLSPTQVTALGDAADAARTAYDNAMATRAAAKAFTLTLNASASDLRDVGGDLVRQIKAFAELQDNPATVYAAAQIPQPADPSPQPAPGRAENITVNLEPSGAVSLGWEATNAAASGGAFFNITRKLPGESGFTPVGGAPGSTTQSRRMRFTDHNVPTAAAATGIQYIITGVRGELTGQPSAVITVLFGTDASGQTFASASGAGVRLAA